MRSRAGSAQPASSTGKRAYELFLDALVRLRSTSIKTTIRAGDQVERRGFGWIETWRVIEHKGRMAAVEVTLNDWMFRAVAQDRRVLTINPEYFRLTKGLERRLYARSRWSSPRRAPMWRSVLVARRRWPRRRMN